MTWKQQENIAYDTKIRYSWWITVAGQAFWHQVSRLSNTFFRPNFRSEFLKNSRVISFFSQENIAYDMKIQYSWWITVAGQAFLHLVSRLSNTFSDRISDRNSWRILESPASFVQEFLKNFRDRYIWTFPVTKRLHFRRQFWSIGVHEEFQGHLLFLTGKYSLWHENPVFVMNYCSWASFLTSGFEIIKHIFRPNFRSEFLKNSGVTCFFRTGILEEFSRHMNFSCHQTATFLTAILIDWNSWRITGSSAFSHRKI